MAESGEVRREVLDGLRAICLGLPDAYEEPAWIGTRWRIRTRTFAHVLLVEHGHPPAYACAAGTGGPATVLTFRSSGPELDVLRGSGHPYFAPRWRGDEVGLVLGDGVDWDEVAELLIESYCTQAPKSLQARVDRPPD